MDDPAYLSVNFTPAMLGITTACALVLGVIPLLLHGLLRRRRFPSLPDREQTYRLRSSIRTELVVGIAGLTAVVALAVYGFATYSASMVNLRSNIEQKYQPTELVLGEFNGSWVNVDLTLEDGTSFTNSPVEIREGNEPFIEDVWYHFHPKPAG